QGAGDKNERDFRCPLLRKRECCKSIKGWEAVIRQDNRRRELFEFSEKRAFCFHAPKVEIKALPAQRVFNKRRVVRLVFDHQYAYLIFNKPELGSRRTKLSSPLRNSNRVRTRLS